ncbi:ABC transporter substrate-binding protein [Angustibacter luteus]|uniref:ABC transporter substrate-binding protein n=1 Tax=Angustibacter luteus TaxID=658456 RepID=A0ABW1J961_9ACTN
MGAGLTALVTMTACSGSSGESAAPTPKGSASGTLNVVVSSATGSDAGFKAVNQAFIAKYPGVKINFTAVPNENYAQAHASRLTAGSIDVGLAGPKELPSYVPAGNEGDDARLADQGGYVDLTNQAFMKKYNPTVLDQIKYKGKNYTVPTGLSYYSGMFYNKKIFADNGIKIPTTWTELMAACETLKAKGIVPLGIGGKDSAGLNMLGVVQSLYPTAQAKDDLAKGLYGGTVKLNDGKQLQVLQNVQKLYSYAEPNFAGVNYATMTADFVNGKLAMMSDGTWNTTTIQQAGGSKLDFGYFPLPASDNAADNKYLGGKVELTLAIPSNAKNKSAAIEYLSFFTDNYQLFDDEAGFAPSVTGAKSNPFYTDIAKYTSTFEPAWDTVWIPNTKAGAAAQNPFNWAGIAPMGKSDPQGAADASEKDWQAGLK